MIDLHSHVLPGVDDGPDDERGSVDLLRAAAADGIATLAATPHVRHDLPRIPLSDVAAACERMNDLDLAGADRVRVVPGGEVDVLWAQTASPDKLRSVSYLQRGTDLLVETPRAALSAQFEELVFKLTVQGFRIVLAHPELNPTFQREPERLAAIVRRGVLVQVTARSLFRGGRRSRSRRLATALVREGLAHVIASDAHSGGAWRPPELTEGVNAAARIAPSRATWMVTDAPAAILAGDPLPPAPAPTTRPWPHRRLFGRQ